MKIAVGLFYLECNSWNPDVTTRDKFVFAEGDDVLRYLHLSELFACENIKAVPTIMASALPAGDMDEDDFWFFTNRILDALRRENGGVDGAFFHLHGALEVKGVGSGDLRLVQEVRKVLGAGVPIAVTLDAHANNAVELADCVCMMRGYHTIPHADQVAAERDAARSLIRFIREKQRIRPALVALPVIVAGEKGLSAREPLQGLFDRCAELERMPEVESASVFMGNPWGDCPNGHMSVVVVPSREEHTTFAREKAFELAKMAFDRRTDFDFETPILEPKAVLDAALAFGKRPVFITDSGDNTTGGATGEGTVMLRAALEHDLGDKKVLVTTVYDPGAFAAVAGLAIGEKVALRVGTGREAISRPVEVSGVVKAKGDLLGYLNTAAEKCGSCATLSVSPNVDLALTNAPGSFITEGHFTAAGLAIADYDVIVLKMGYLFAQLRPLAATYFLALTDGATTQFLENLDFKRIARPMYPLDKDVEFAVPES